MKIKLLKIILVIAIISSLYSAYHLMTWSIDNQKTNNIVKKINIISKEEIKEDKTLSIDFNQLLQTNNEVVGWIKINGTKVDYPIVKHNDNSYYLTHSFDKTENEAGWIFMDSRNNHNNLDFNTIIYGHGRRDGSMFGGLFQTLNKEWINNEVLKLGPKVQRKGANSFRILTCKLLELLSKLNNCGVICARMLWNYTNY